MFTPIFITSGKMDFINNPSDGTMKTFRNNVMIHCYNKKLANVEKLDYEDFIKKYAITIEEVEEEHIKNRLEVYFNKPWEKIKDTIPLEDDFPIGEYENYCFFTLVCKTVV